MIAAALPGLTGTLAMGGWNLVQRRRLADARTDPVSGVATRAAFTTAAGRALRRRRDWVLLAVDGDGFKAINDTHGHNVGDSAIAALAARLATFASRGGLVGRIGGDEFLVLLPDDGTPLAERLDGLCWTLSAPHRYGAGLLRIGASVGAVRTTDLAAPTLPQAMKAADLALYAAKDGGRGTWRIAAPGPDPYPIENAPARRTRTGRSAA